MTTVPENVLVALIHHELSPKGGDDDEESVDLCLLEQVWPTPPPVGLKGGETVDCGQEPPEPPETVALPAEE